MKGDEPTTKTSDEVVQYSFLVPVCVKSLRAAAESKLVSFFF